MKQAVVINFDCTSQLCDVQFDDEIVKSVSMGKAILRMALDLVDVQEKIALTRQMQASDRVAAENRVLAKQLLTK